MRIIFIALLMITMVMVESVPYQYQGTYSFYDVTTISAISKNRNILLKQSMIAIGSSNRVYIYLGSLQNKYAYSHYLYPSSIKSLCWTSEDTVAVETQKQIKFVNIQIGVTSSMPVEDLLQMKCNPNTQKYSKQLPLVLLFPNQLVFYYYDIRTSTFQVKENISGTFVAGMSFDYYGHYLYLYSEKRRYGYSLFPIQEVLNNSLYDKIEYSQVVSSKSQKFPETRFAFLRYSSDVIHPFFKILEYASYSDDSYQEYYKSIFDMQSCENSSYLAIVQTKKHGCWLTIIDSHDSYNYYYKVSQTYFLDQFITVSDYLVQTYEDKIIVVDKHQSKVVCFKMTHQDLTPAIIYVVIVSALFVGFLLFFCKSSVSIFNKSISIDQIKQPQNPYLKPKPNNEELMNKVVKFNDSEASSDKK